MSVKGELLIQELNGITLLRYSFVRFSELAVLLYFQIQTQCVV